MPLDYSGVTLTCLAFGVPIITSVDWYRVNSEGSTERYSSNINRHQLGFFSSKLIFPSGFRPSDAGLYACLAHSMDVTSTQTAAFTLEPSMASLPAPPAPCLANSTMAFQIEVLSTSCSEWDASLKQQVTFEVQRSLIGVLAVQCDECNLITHDDLMLTVEPICNSRGSLFRGVISRETQAIFCTLNTWVQLGSTIRIRNTLQLIDSSCSLEIKSLNSTECELKAQDIQEALLSPTVIGSTASVLGVAVVGAVLASITIGAVVKGRYVGQ